MNHILEIIILNHKSKKGCLCRQPFFNILILNRIFMKQPKYSLLDFIFIVRFDSMNILNLFSLLALFIIFVLLFPDIFPKCILCGKTKLRFFFKIHKAVGIMPGYGSNKSVCKKCCKSYNIISFSDLNKVINAKSKAEIELIKLMH